MSAAAPTLHRDGYILLKNWTTVPDAVLTSLRARADAADPIFNAPGRNDNRRRQCSLRASPGSWLDQTRQRLCAEFATPAHTPSGFVLLISDPGCARQAAHQDYVPTPALQTATAETMPLLCLVGLEPDTMLDVWSPADAYCRRTLHFGRGDVIVFRADLVHAGSAYSTTNMRIHCYLDHPAVPRVRNHTWIIGKHGSAEERARIVEDK